MKTLQESVNFILADESMRYVEQDGRVRETGTKLFYKYFGEQLMCTREHHSLFFEVLDVSALRKELRHIAHLMSSLLR